LTKRPLLELEATHGDQEEDGIRRQQNAKLRHICTKLAFSASTLL